MLDNYLSAIETMDEALIYCQYIESCCPDIDLDFLDNLDIDIVGTNWNEPTTGCDFNNIAVMALISAENCDESNEKEYYVEYAIATLNKGIQLTDSFLCKAHLSIVYALSGDIDKSRQMAYDYISESVQIEQEQVSELGLIYLPAHSRNWEGIAQDKLPIILQLSDGNKQALAIFNEVIYQLIPNPQIDSYRILLVVSGGLKEFVENTLLSIGNCNIDLRCVEIFTPKAGREELLEMRSQYGVNITLIEDIAEEIDLQNSNDYHDYGTGEFGKFTLSKWIAIKQLLTQGVQQVIYTDVDVAWRQDPIPLLQQIGKHYSLSIQTEGNACFPPHLCTGFMSFINTEFSHRLLSSLINLHSQVIKTNPECHDQIVINHLLESSPYLMSYIYPLSELLFLNGSAAKLLSTVDSDLSSTQTGQPNPMIFHANWTVGLANKKYMLQRTGNWFVKENPLQSQAKKYKIGNYEILLSIDHMLDGYQSRWKRYDTVLGNIAKVVFAKYPNSTAIDIGANVGDSAALINKYINVPILCIEGHPDFIPFLEHNALLLGDVHIVPCFIGEDGQTISLDNVSSRGGTASIANAITEINSDNQINLKSLKSILEMHPRFNQSKLLKIDCDGFDFDIIKDSIETIKNFQPVICFEYDISFRASGMDEAVTTIDNLARSGYSYFLVYDNFGNYLISVDNDIRGKFDDLNSCLKCNRYQSGEVVIYYLDVYAFHVSDYDLFVRMRGIELSPD